MCRSETLVEDKFVGLGLRHGYNGTAAAADTLLAQTELQLEK